MRCWNYVSNLNWTPTSAAPPKLIVTPCGKLKNAEPEKIQILRKYYATWVNYGSPIHITVGRGKGLFQSARKKEMEEDAINAEIGKVVEMIEICARDKTLRMKGQDEWGDETAKQIAAKVKGLRGWERVIQKLTDLEL